MVTRLELGITQLGVAAVTVGLGLELLSQGDGGWGYIIGGICWCITGGLNLFARPRGLR